MVNMLKMHMKCTKTYNAKCLRSDLGVSGSCLIGGQVL